MTKKKTEIIEKDIKIKIIPSCLPIINKKQQYIYVARNKKTIKHITTGKEIYYVSKERMKLVNNVFKTKKLRVITPKDLLYFYGLKLKKGEQKRMPILVDKAEVVK